MLQEKEKRDMDWRNNREGTRRPFKSPTRGIWKKDQGGEDPENLVGD